MPTTPPSTPSSSASATSPTLCRSRFSGEALREGPLAKEAAPAKPVAIRWRPSTYVVATLGAFGPLGAISLLASDLPAVIAWPASALAVVLAWRAAAREAGRPPVTVTFPLDAPPALDGQPLGHARLQWRGSLSFLQWRDGRRLRGLSWWPDTLPPAARRELRLAAGAPVTARDGGSVAP